MNLTSRILTITAKLISGATVRWVDCQPDTTQRVYFANHTSHLDAPVLWASLPDDLRLLTRPVAAKDYWEKGRIRPHIAKAFNALLIDRKKIKVHSSPVDLMIKAIGHRDSLIVFPEGSRNTDDEMGTFKSGIYYLAKKRPDLELVPVYIDNLNRVLPRGEYLPVPLLSCITIGQPMWLEAGEPKVEFLTRAREAVRRLRDASRMSDLLPNLTCHARPLFLLQSAAEGQDIRTLWLMGVVLGVLAAAFLVGRILRKQPEGTVNPAVARMFNLRIKAWWAMCAILIAGIMMGRLSTVLLFFLASFWALREFITMTNTRRGDHRALFWAFFAITPIQYVLTGLTWNDNYLYAQLFIISVPLLAGLAIPARIAFSGDPKRFLERSAKIQAGLIICVYALSHAPALLNLKIEVNDQAWTGQNGLLFYFIVIVQLGDVFQYGWGKLLGRRVIAPAINENRTWEGFIGGVTSTTIMGTLLAFATPFQLWEAACISMLTAVAGFAGGMTMSAIKRDRGVMDYGTLVQGHAGVLDRIDSICFAAPVFFHLTRIFTWNFEVASQTMG